VSLNAAEKKSDEIREHAPLTSRQELDSSSKYVSKQTKLARLIGIEIFYTILGWKADFICAGIACSIAQKQRGTGYSPARVSRASFTAHHAEKSSEIPPFQNPFLSKSQPLTS
jgi:hypothetical protein